MKGCELCDRAAGLYCESDQASLCWECDAKVHGANFLVARHARVLLCRRCQAPTSWRAEGERISAAISVCQRCTIDGKAVPAPEEEESEGEAEGGWEMMEEDEEEDYADYESDVEEEDEEDGENQVVPWALSPPPLESSSSDEESSSPEMARSVFFQRMRENEGLASQNNLAFSSFHHPNNLGRSRVHQAARPPVVGAGAGGDSHFFSNGDYSSVGSVSSAFRSPPI